MATDEEIKKVIEQKTQQLEKLKAKMALYGFNTPPEIIIQIEDIETEIEELQKGTKNLETSSKIVQNVEDKPIQTLIDDYTKQLDLLKQQQALFGFSIPPEILIKIEDIEAQIKTLKQKLEHKKLTVII